MPLEYLGAPPVASDRQARPFSPAVRAGDFIYVSGQVPANADGEIVAGLRTPFCKQSTDFANASAQRGDWWSRYQQARATGALLRRASGSFSCVPGSVRTAPVKGMISTSQRSGMPVPLRWFWANPFTTLSE